MAHPSREQLLALQRGDAAPEVSAHVDGCATCRTQLDDATRSHQSASEPPTRDLPQPASLALRPGELVGRYVVLAPIGKGGMGAVYLAYDPTLDRRVALKLVLPSRDDSASAARLEREARALARVTHPNAVAVYDAGRFGDQVFIAMERVEGQTLREWMKTRGWREVLEVMVQAGRGLEAVHQAGLVHRDFKPGNVLVTREGEARVLDFGLARAQSHSFDDEPGAPPTSAPEPFDPQLTAEGAVAGTPGYIAPELYRGEPATPASDQFAFGVTLFMALYGRKPFEGRPPREQVRGLESPLRPQPADAKVPRWLWPLVTRCLAKRPEDRWPSLSALLTALSTDPTLRWKRAGQGVGLVAALVLTAWWVRPAPPPPCATAAELTQSLWPESAQTALRQRAGATPVQARRMTRAVEFIGKRVETWARESEATCAAVRQLHVDPLVQRRRDCLDAQGRRLTVLVEALAQLDVSVAQRADEVVSDFLSRPSCDGAAAQVSSLDSSPQVVALQATLFRAQALTLLGQNAQGEALAQGVVDVAADAGLRALEAEGHFRVAMAKANLTAETLDHVERAWVLSLAAGEDALALEACFSMVNGLTDRRGLLAEAEVALPTCWALWRRLGRDRWAEAQLRQVDALMRYQGGRLESAIEEQRRAVELLRTLRSPYATSAALHLLASFEWEAGHHTISNELELQSFMLLESVDPDSPALLERAGELAAGLLDSCRFDEALKVLEPALTRAQEQSQLDPDVLAGLELTRATLAAALKDPRALEWSTRGLARYEALPTSPRDLAWGLRMHASVLLFLGDSKGSLAACRRAAASAADVADGVKIQARSDLLCEADALVALAPAQALERYVKLEALREGDTLDVLASIHFGHARSLRATGGDRLEARRLAERALTELKTLGACTHRVTEVEAWLEKEAAR